MKLETFDRGEFELVNFCLSLSFLGFRCLVFICILQNKTRYMCPKNTDAPA